MKKIQIITAAITGFTAVALGAFGAHGLSGVLSGKMMETYHTGVLYHLVHSVFLLAIALSSLDFRKSFWISFTGILLFSFSLYLYAITGILFFAMITPFGGICLLLGWALLIYDAIRNLK